MMQNLMMVDISREVVGRTIARGWVVVWWKTDARAGNEGEEGVKIFSDGYWRWRGSKMGASDSISLLGELAEICSLRYWLSAMKAGECSILGGFADVMRAFTVSVGYEELQNWKRKKIRSMTKKKRYTKTYLTITYLNV